MSPEERQLITGLFDRIRSAANTPRDPEAEALIADAVKSMPYAPYFLVQAVLVQDQALRAANERPQQLEARLSDLEQQGQGQRPGSAGFLGGLGSIFGSPGPQTQPRGPWGPPASQQQSYPPPPEPGPWGGVPQAGGGFLQGALGTAAGVSGGVLLADSIRGLFGGNHGGLGIGSGLGGLGGGETIVNNYYDDTPGADAADPGTTVVDDYDDTNSGDFDSGGGDETYDV
jgi:uncharacterized protein